MLREDGPGRLVNMPKLNELQAWYPCQKVVMSNAKQAVESLLNRLPDNVSVEDIQYHLYVLDKVRRGLDDARINGTLSQEEVETRFSQWLTE
jgi:hypothetical protein